MGRYGRKETQCQLCKRLAWPIIPHSWSGLVWKRVSLVDVIIMQQSRTIFLSICPFSAWWQPNEQQCDPRASLLLTSEKAVFCKNPTKKRREETQISIFHPKSALEVFCVRRGRSNSRPGFAFHRPSSQHHHHREEMMEGWGWERRKEEYHTIKMWMVEYICLKSRQAAEDLMGKT